jgi:hypothetical protein
MPTSPEHPEQIPDMSPADTAWLMNALWESLQSPDWSFSSRKDLEQLGTAIYSGKKLKELDSQLLNRLFPHLKKITLHLGKLLTHRVSKPVSPPAESVPPTESASETPPSNETETPHE